MTTVNGRLLVAFFCIWAGGRTIVSGLELLRDTLVQEAMGKDWRLFLAERFEEDDR